jgi:hypothetical protein
LKLSIRGRSWPELELHGRPYGARRRGKGGGSEERVRRGGRGETWGCTTMGLSPAVQSYCAYFLLLLEEEKEKREKKKKKKRKGKKGRKNVEFFSNLEISEEKNKSQFMELV